MPYGDTELCPVRALTIWLQAAAIAEGAVLRRIWLPPGTSVQTGSAEALTLPRLGAATLTSQSVAQIMQARALAAGFGRRDLGGHSLKRGALTAGMERGIRQAQAARSSHELLLPRRIPQIRRPLRRAPTQRNALIKEVA